jgi:Mg-chelatase subunit ChlD
MKKSHIIIGAVAVVVLLIAAGVIFAIRGNTQTAQERDDKERMQDGGSRQESDGLREGGDTENPRAEMTENGSCQAQFEELVAEHGEDFSDCAEGTELESCEKPDGVSEEELNKKLNVQIILDSSGSMAGMVGSKTKLDVAKEALSDFVTTLPEDSQVALRVYGHKGSNADSDKQISCQGTELLYDFKPLNTDDFADAIQAFQPTGWTPIASSLEEAGKDFSSYSADEHNNIVYLVSDGIETCDGDPVVAAEQLQSSGVRAVVNVIGFDVDAQAQAQLRQVAEMGGGNYYDAQNEQEFKTIFEKDIDWQKWEQYKLCIARKGSFYEFSTLLNQSGLNNICLNRKNAQERQRLSMYARGSEYRQCSEYINNKVNERYKERKAEIQNRIEGRVEQADEKVQEANEEADEILKDLESQPGNE